jgi:hypothetical protein
MKPVFVRFLRADKFKPARPTNKDSGFGDFAKPRFLIKSKKIPFGTLNPYRSAPWAIWVPRILVNRCAVS